MQWNLHVMNSWAMTKFNSLKLNFVTLKYIKIS
jgi:hypothetical protein